MRDNLKSKKVCSREMEQTKIIGGFGIFYDRSWNRFYDWSWNTTQKKFNREIDFTIGLIWALKMKNFKSSCRISSGTLHNDTTLSNNLLSSGQQTQMNWKLKCCHFCQEPCSSPSELSLPTGCEFPPEFGQYQMALLLWRSYSSEMDSRDGVELGKTGICKGCLHGRWR